MTEQAAELAEAEAEDQATEGESLRAVRHVTTYADIEAVEVECVWRGRIPMGEVTLVVAKGGTGKTFALIDVGARVTRGDAMPDGTPGCPAGSVVYISADDDPAAVLKWRVMAARAEEGSMIEFSEPDGAPFKIGGKTGCVRALHQMVAARGDVRMVVIDPLARTAGVAITSTKTINSEIMDPLRRLARKTGCAVVLVHHETKDGTVAGGQALWDSARSLLAISKGDDGVRSITVEKSNMFEDQAEPIRYRLAGVGHDTHVEWLGEDTPQGLEGAPGQNAILRELAASGPKDSQALSAATGLPYTSVRVLLTTLKRKGLVTQPRRGLWAVSAENVRVIDQATYEAEKAAGTLRGPVIEAQQLVPDASGYGMVGTS